MNTIRCLAAVLSTWISVSTSNDARAGEGPSGLVGRAQSVPAGAMFPGGSGQYFEWYQFIGVQAVKAAEMVDLSFAIIPFANGGAGVTSLSLDTEGGATFLELNFSDGLVNDLVSYDPNGWNTVRLTLDFGHRTCQLSVNGGQAVAFPSGIAPIEALRLSYNGRGRETALGWFDSLSISMGASTLFAVDFDSRFPGADSLCLLCKLDAVPAGALPEPCCTNTIRPSTELDGWAGRAETGFDSGMLGMQYFEWLEYFVTSPSEIGAPLEVSFFILPFAGEGAGATHIGFDAADAGTFIGVSFKEGLVNGSIPYEPGNWNAVKIAIDFQSQTFRVAINGAESESLPFVSPSRSAQAFRVNYLSPGMKPAVAWFDSVRITGGGSTELLSIDFDRTLPRFDNVAAAGQLTAEDPVPNASPPGSDQLSILSGPSSQKVTLGQTVTFSVRATGMQPLAYQWEFNGIPIAGARNATVTVANVSPELQGNYAVMVIDARGATARSERAVLSVLQSGGSVYFSNRVVPEVDAPVFAQDGLTPLAGDQFFAQLYGGPSVAALAPVGPPVPFRSGAAAGYWVTAPDAVRLIPTVTPGAAAFLQVRAWEAGYGTTFEQTQARGAPVGASEIVEIISGGAGSPPSIPPNLRGLQSFSLTQSLRPELGGQTQPAADSNRSGARVRVALDSMSHTVQLSISGQPGATYEIERSSDLVHWEPSARVARTGADLLFREFAPSPSRQFYRVFVLPWASE